MIQFYKHENKNKNKNKQYKLIETEIKIKKNWRTPKGFGELGLREFVFTFAILNPKFVKKIVTVDIFRKRNCYFCVVGSGKGTNFFF